MGAPDLGAPILVDRGPSDTIMCPVLSTQNPQGIYNRVNCIAQQCACWKWLINPSVKSRLGMSMPEPPATIGWQDFSGVGRCTHPMVSR